MVTLKALESTSVSTSSADGMTSKRQATVYDAVAGRGSSTGFIPIEPRVSKNRDTPSSTTTALPPEEILFRRQGAPARYEENDFYWADRNLTETQKLPDSDLLKAIHAYASDFYGRATKNGGEVDFESFDETALLGLGILLEEAAGNALGDTGDLAFIEGEEVDEEDDKVGPESSQRGNQTDTAEVSAATASEGVLDVEKEPDMGRKRKRRKIKHHDGSNQ